MTKIFYVTFLLGTFILVSSIFFWIRCNPKIVVTPEYPLVDESVEIVISNLSAKCVHICNQECWAHGLE